MKFVSFHTHSTYSYADGFGTVEQHVKRVADLGMSSLALSEHGNVNSHVALEKACRGFGIHPIFGIETYFSPPQERRKFHLGLYAINEEGYRNLNRIVTQSYLDAYQYPTVTWECLERYNAGIAALSGCSDSLISCTLLGGKSLGDKRQTISEQDYRNALKEVGRFQRVFGDRFYLEVQRFPKLERTCLLNPTLLDLADETGAHIIATADVHYPYPYQNEMQKVLHASRRNSTVAVTESTWEYDILLTYPESDEELVEDLINTGMTIGEAKQALRNTAKLAEECNVELPKAKPLKFPVDEATTPQRYFNKVIMDGWRRRIDQRPELKDRVDEYKARIISEYKIIKNKGFIDYFLATADLVKWSKDNGITVGPARGSAAGSLICYLLRITEIDPLHPAFDRMVFERFIDPTRSDMPDIDLDFDDELRHKVVDQARRIYGQDNVASVGNHIKYRGRAALQGVARAYGIPQKSFDAIGIRCPIRTETDERMDDSIQDVLDSYSSEPEVKVLVDKYGKQLQQAIQLEGNQQSMGIHAGGFVISSEPIPDICALYSREKGQGRNKEWAQIIPYEKRDAEYLGFLKMDFLGLRAMGMIGLCLKWTELSLDTLYSLFYKEWGLSGLQENDVILKRFSDDDVTGIFQYEGGTTRGLMRRLGVATFDHLAAVSALSRPGPYYGGQADAYIAVKNGEKEIDRIHDHFDKHVEWTYGQIVYQEQIMWILRDVAGFDIPKVLRVRKIIGKKLGEHQFALLWDDFKTGCADTSGLSEENAMRIWGAITTAAGYAFNIAHAYSYALVAWWQMYFKINFPDVFFAASLAKNGDGKDELPRRIALLQDAIQHSITILNFSAELSQENWIRTGTGIRPGFRQIPKIGEATAQDIVSWRGTEIKRREEIDPWGAAITWDDFFNINGIGEKTVALLKEFSSKADPFGINRTSNQLGAFRKELENGDYIGSGLPSRESFYGSDNLPVGSSIAFVGIVNNVIYRDEVETIRSRTGQTIDEIRASLDSPDKTKKALIFAYDETGEVALRVSRWRYPYLARKLASLKPGHHIIVASGQTYEGKENSIQVKEIWTLEPDD